MRVISWNVRGLGCIIKRRSVRNFLVSNKVDIILLQETKIHDWSIKLAKSCWGNIYDEWLPLKAIGSAGGQCIAWKSGRLVKLECFTSEFFITVKLKDLKDDSFVYVTSVYGPPYYELRDEFWLEFSDLQVFKNSRWIMGGDFNVTRFAFERTKKR